MSLTETSTVKAACHCGKNKFDLVFPTSSLPVGTDLCHCDGCQRVSGMLFINYIEIPRSLIADPEDPPPNLKLYRSSAESKRYFCSTCGAHIAFYGRNKWFVAIGNLERVDGVSRIEWHQFVEDTVDGGMTNCLQDGLSMWAGHKGYDAFKPVEVSIEEKPVRELLVGKCHCGNLKMTIHRPSYADITEGDARRCVGKDKRRWLAAHCLCTSCRKTSGFSCTSWTFVPKQHIDLDPDTKLETFNSSEGIERLFCGTCGATVFYECDRYPNCYDVALGLFETEKRGLWEFLNDWFHFLRWDQVSYTEDAVDTEFKEKLLSGLKKLVE
jgi:hypothetical protein